MSSENMFTFSVATEAKVQVERESLTQSKKVLDDFYDEYSNKEIDIGFDSKTLKQNISNANKAVADFINKTRKYMKEYNSVVSEPVSWMDADQMKDDFADVIPTVKDFLSDVRIIFGDGTELFGFDEIFKELEDGATQFEHHLSTGIKSVDLGGQLDKIKQDAADVFAELEELFDYNHYNDGSLMYDFGKFNQGNLQKAIELLTKLAHLQNAISTFSNKKLKSEDFVSKDASQYLTDQANTMQKNLDLMRTYRLQTMEELNKRQEIARSVNSRGEPLDMDDAMKQVNNEEIYKENLQALQDYIDKRRELLNTLYEEPDLFRFDESGVDVGDGLIEGYRETLEDQISNAISSMDQLREARQKLLDDNNLGANINFTQVIRELGEIKKAIQDLGKAFKPFTDAMADSESGLAKMIQTSADEVDGLIQKFNELGQTVDAISKKDFNIVQHIQTGGTDTSEIVEYRKTVKTLYSQIEGLYNDVQSTIVQLSQAGRNDIIGDIIQSMGNFDIDELKKKTQHRSVESLAVDILDLSEAKQLLIDINELRNKLLGQGTWKNIYPDVNIPSKNRDVEQVDANNNSVLGNPLLNIEQMMDQISFVTEQMKEKFNDVKQKINDTFDFSNIQVNYGNIQSATDKIYSYFEKLHKKILDLDFTINIPGVINSKDMPTSNAELVDNYGQKLDDVNSKLLQGTKLLNEQGQIIRLFHNSDTVFDKFDTSTYNKNMKGVLGSGSYLSFDQSAYLDYGKYQTQWYANIQKIFDAGVHQQFSIEEATKIVETYCTDAMDTFGKQMLSQLTSGDAFNAVGKIMEKYDVDMADIFKTAGYDAVKMFEQINIFDPNNLYRANSNALQCDTEDFKVAAELTTEIFSIKVRIQNLENSMSDASEQEKANIQENLNLENERLSTLQEQLAVRQKAIDAATAKALGIDTSATESTTPLFAEVEAMKQIEESARAAAESKKAFADANEQVRVSAQQSAPALLAEKTALGGVDEAAKEQLTWKVPRTQGSLEGLNLPTRFEGENGQSIASLFAQVKSQIEMMTGSPVTIDFVSKVNDDGQLEAVGATLKYINEESGVTIKQFYDIARVTEETADGEREIIVATQSAEKAMLGTAKAAKVFNSELQQQFALEQVKSLKAEMGDLELDLTQVSNAASSINDKASLDEFNLQLRIAKEQVKQLKIGLKGQNSLDTVAAAEKRLLTLPDKIEILRQKLKSLGDVEGVEKVSEIIDNIERAYNNFNRETDANKKVDIFKDIISNSVRAESAINRIKNSDAFSNAREIQSLEERYVNLNDALEKYKNNLSLKSNTDNVTDASLIIDLIESYQRYYNELDRNDSTYVQERLAILQEIDKLYGQLQSKMALVNSEQQVANAEAAKQKKEYDDLAKKQDELYRLKTQLAKAEYGSENEKNLAEQVKEKEAALESEIEKSKHQNALRERAIQLEKDLNAVIADRRKREEDNAWDTLQTEQQKEKDKQIDDTWKQEEAQRLQDDKDSLKAKKEVAAMDAQIAAQQKKEYDDLYARQEALYSKKMKLAKAEYGSENAKNLAEQINTEEAALNDAIAQSEHQNVLLERRVQLEKDLNAVITDRRRKEEDAAWQEVESERNKQDNEKNKQIEDTWAQEDKQKEEELNALYKERQTIISNIAKLDNDVRNAKNEQGKAAAEELLRIEEQRLAAINQEISAYGNLVDEQRLASQDSGLDERVRKNSYASYIKSETDAQNEADKQQEKQFDKILKKYNEYLKARESIQKMDSDMSGKDYTAPRKLAEENSAKLQQELLDLGVDINAIEKNNVLTQEQKNALLEAEEKHRQRIQQIIANSQSSSDTKKKKEQERVDKQNQNYGKSIYNSTQRKYDATAAEVEVVGITDPKVLAQLDTYKNKLQELKSLRDQFANDPTASSNEGLRQIFNKTAVEAENLRKGIQAVIKEAKKMDSIPEDLIIGKGDVFDTSSVDNIKKSIKELADSLFQGKAQITGWSDDGKQAFLTFNNGAGSIERVTIALKEGTGQLIAYRDATNKSKTAFDSLKDTFGKQLKSLASRFLGIHEAIQALRTGFEAVKEIDAALTELKKVTDETEASYKRFLETASKAAGKIGSTVSDFTEATANFARLGYTMEESAKMAETAIVYKNVADGLDTVEESTESIISTMKAFGIESDNTMSIIDKFNEVGNNFAITSAGIGEALQRSASALFEAGNTIDESVALVTAGNSVIQNPEQVGTALKTLALRLRGAKTELEDAGEDVDGMAESTSQLQAKLKALTHGKVDIMLDENTFKSTTQILREMSDAWKDMTDIERSAALELMGGKRQANILSSIIKNFNTVEEVIQTSQDSTGSALKENEKYLDSIQGKLDQLSNSTQTMWMHFMNSDAVKLVVELLNDIVKLVDKVGLLNVAVATLLSILAYKSKANVFEMFVTTFKSLGSGTISLTKNIYAWVSSLIAARNATAVATVGTKQLAVAQAQQNATGTIGAKISQFLASAFTATGAAAEAASWKVQLLSSALTFGLSLLAGYALPKIIEWFDNLHESAEETAEKVQELNDTYKNAKDEFSEKIEILTTTDTEGYDDLLSEFEDLAKGVNNLGDNISLTTDEYSRYKEICEKIVGVNPSLVNGYNDATEAISANKGVLAELIELEKEQARLAAAEYVSEGKYSNNGNWDSLVTNAYDEKQKADQELYKYTHRSADGIKSIEDVLREAFDWDNIGSYDYGAQYTDNDDLAKFVMESIGISPEQINEDLEQYYNENGGFDFDRWIDDYADDIASAKQEFLDKISKMKLDDSAIGDARSFAESVLKYSGEDFNGWAFGDGVNGILNRFTNGDGTFDYDQFVEQYGGYIGQYKDFILSNAEDLIYTWADGYSDVKDAADDASNGMIDALLEVPNSIKGYADLDIGVRSFFTEWIKNSDAFKVPEGATEEEIAEVMENNKDTIIKAINSVMNNQTLSELMEEVKSLDVSEYSTFGKYTTKISDLFNGIYENLKENGLTEIFGLDDTNYEQKLSVWYNIEWAINDSDGTSDLDKFIVEAKSLTGKSDEEIIEYLNKLPPVNAQRMIKYDYTSMEGHDNPDTPEFDGTGTLEQMYDAANPIIDKGYTNIIQTYSNLSEAIDKVNTALETSKEVFSAGAKVTEDYYNSLVELGISTDDLSECIDKESGYIVTNVDKLNELLKAQKDTVAWNIKLGKSQAELQYNDVIRSISDQITSTTILENVNEELVDSLFEQANALRATINQYQLLESSLLGATNAFTQFSNAQEIDSQNTYGSTLVDMVQTMYDAIYKTGEVGSEAFWAAVKATVPDDVYMGLAPGEQQIKAISRYLQDNLFSGLTFSGDSFSIDYSSIESFVKKAQSKGLFSGTDTTAFGLSPAFMASLEDGENGLKKFAEQLGVTEEYVYAIFSEMDKYNSNSIGLSMLFQLDSSTSSQLTILNTQLEQALATRKRLLEQGADLADNTAEIYDIQSQQAGVKAQATANTARYLTVANALEDPTKTVGETLSEQLIIEIGLQGKEGQTIESVFQEVSDWLLQLEEPTVLDLEVSKDSIQDSIKELEDEFGEEKLKADLQLMAEGKDTTIDKTVLENYSKLLNIDQFISDALSENLTRTETLLDEIATNTGIMAGTKEAPKEEPETKTESTTTSDNSGVEATTENQQSQKPEINPEAVEYNMAVDKAINDLMTQLANKKVELLNSPDSFGRQNDLDSIDKLQQQILEIRKEFDNPDSIIPTEDLMAQWSRVKTEAAQYGIEVPLTIKVNKDALSSDINETIDAFAYNGNVDLNSRQLVPFDEEHFKSWADYYRDVIEHANEYSAEYVAGVKEDLASIERGDSTATVYSQTYWKSDFAENGELEPGEENYAIVLTPILPDGTVISPEALNTYAERLFNGEEIEPQITLGIFDGENFKEDAAQFAERLHEDQAILYDLDETAQETKESLDQLFKVKVPDSEVIKMLQALSDEDKKKALTVEDAAILGFNLDEGQILTAQEALDKIIARNQTLTSGLYNVKQAAIETYSTLQSQVSSYNDIVSQTEEIMANGTKVTEEYKNVLVELGVDKNELNDCFDVGTGLIVKDIDALKKLVDVAKKNTSTNVKLAKSQTQLKYYELVKELSNTIDGMKDFSNASMSTANSIKEQINTVKQAVYQYQLLENSLLGTTNAFEKYKEAQEIDSLNTYGDDYVGMAQTMYDALYKTGQVGTEQMWAAVDALVPDSVYQGLTEDADKMKAIYEYFNKKILPTLTLDNDKISIEYRDVENFVKKAKEAGVITGDKKKFNLVEGMNLEKAAELMGITKERAYAMFAELDKYNVSRGEQSFLGQLDDSTSGKIMRITTQIEELNNQKLELLRDGGYEKNKEQIDAINKQLDENDVKLKEIGKDAYDAWQAYTKTDAALAALKQIEDKTSALSVEDAIQLGIEWAEGMTVQDVINQLEEQLANLEATDALTAQLSIDYIDIQLSGLQTALDKVTNGGTLSDNEKVSLGLEIDATQEELKASIDSKIQALKEEKVVLATTFGIELTEEEKEALKEELNAIEEFKINDKEFKVSAKGTSATMLQLMSIKQWLDSIKDKNINITTTTTTVRKTVDVNPSDGDVDAVSGAGVNGTAHANGTAHKSGSWGAPKTETALVGELGPELLVRGNRWTTVGENGAEFTDVRKGDIIFNHKQTEDLLSKGYITGRGKAFAEGTAYSGLWSPTSPNTSLSNTSGSSLADDAEDAADEFREVFDWIAVRIEEINEDIELKSAKLENAIGFTKQNALIDDMIELNQKLYDNLTAGAATYYKYAQQLLAKIPAEYRAAAQDGSIAIEEFVGEVGEETYNAIEDYREWVQKGADYTQQAEEALTEISSLAKQAIDNISTYYQNKISIGTNKIDQFEAYNALLETTKGYESTNIYQEMIKENNKNIQILRQQRDQMQAELNKRVEAGEIKKYSQDWYDAVNSLAEVDTEIINLTEDTYNYQDSINELHWDQFDALIDRLDAISNESNNLIDILSAKDLVNEDTAEWTDEGITSLGLYAQQMEVAEIQAKKYAEEITYLNKNWKKLGYTEQEYVDKLEELKEKQYDAIKSYNSTKDAIVDLNKERIDAIKNGIEKEIESYQKLIETKKNELSAEKD